MNSRTARIWSAQHPSVLEELHASGSYRATWERTDLAWRAAYRWIALQMQQRGTGVTSTVGVEPALNGSREHAPIWGWHSCGAWQRAPTEETIEALKSEEELERSVVLLELEIPVEALLLSWYSDWNELLDRMLEGRSLSPKSVSELFEVSEAQYREERRIDDDVQASFFALEASWLRSVQEWPSEAQSS